MSSIVNKLIHPHQTKPTEATNQTSATTSASTTTSPTKTSSTMSLPLANKVALITGGSKGIGAATAIALSKLGASIAINYSSDSATAESLINKSLGGPSRALAVKADASTLPGIQSLVAAVVERFKKIDILIPNAGILPMKTISSTSEADFDKAYNLNVKGPFFLVQTALPHMPKDNTPGSPRSSIVFISTTQCTASSVTPPYTLYCSTKGAIEQLTRCVSKDLVGQGINVNAVAPGPTGTELFYEGKSEKVLEMIRGMNPQGRIGEPGEVAEAIAMLCTSASRWVSGQVVRVNGGAA
jgi:3-oxoacyl-[acyl-carrier protein] reductase